MSADAPLDRAAFEALYVRLERPIYNVVHRRLWDAQESHEVVQEAFVQLWRMRSRVRTETVEPLVWRIALNVASKRVRTRRLWRWLSFDADKDVRQVPEDLTHRERALRDAVDALPDKLRDVVLLCELSGMSYADVAVTLSIPAGTVASRRHLAVERLRGILTEDP